MNWLAFIFGFVISLIPVILLAASVLGGGGNKRGTTTGRLPSVHPNLQQQPKQEEGTGFDEYLREAQKR